MRVTSKGQVTIPQDIRRRLGVEPGSEVDFEIDFEIDDDVVRPVRRAEGRGPGLARQMGRHHLTMTTDEIMALTRGKS